MSNRPLKINGSTSPISLKEMTDADIEYITYRVLYEFANTQSGTGTLNLNGNGTTIGSFVDTSRPYNVGQHPVGTEINTNTIVFYQDRSSVTPNPSARPTVWNGSNVQQINDSQLNDVVMFNAGIRLTSGGIGSYYLASSTPTNGSWLEIDSFNDIAASGNTTYRLFRKINDSSSPTVRPLKTVSGGLREMTDAEIDSLVNNFREYIRTTGVGYYSLQASAPTNGTYISNSDTVTDTRNEIDNITYIGTSVYTSTGSYTGERDFTGTRNFTGARTFTRFFSGRQVNYVGERSFTGTRTFTGTRSFTGNRSYIGPAPYVGTTVLSEKETISTRTLWVKQS